MKNSKTDLLREIESLKTENQRLSLMTGTIQNPELQWWAKRNAEVVLALDENHNILSVTPSILPLLGYEPSEIISKKVDWFIHSFDQPLLMRQFELMNGETGKETVVHIRVKHKDDSWLWIEVTLSDQAENPEIESMLVIFRVLRMAKALHGEGSLQRVRYHDLLNAVSDGLFVCIMRADGSAGNFIETNDVACSMLGYEKEALLNLSFKEIDSDYNEEEYRDKGKTLLAGEGLMFETLLCKKDGSVIPVEINASIYRLEEQRAMISIIRDISVRRQTEKELQKNYTELELHRKQLELQYRELTLVREELEESLGNYSFLYDFAPSGYFSLGRDSNIHRLNLRAATLLGMERSGLIGVKFNRFVDRQSLVEFQNFLRNIFDIRGKADCEIILRNEGSGQMVIHLEGIISDDGLDCFAMAMDITERKKAEDALKESETRFQNAFEYSTIGIALVSPQGKFLRVNQSLCRLLGYEQEDLIARNFRDITHPDDVNNNVDYLKRMLSGEIETFEVEKRFFHKSGNIVWAVLSSSIVRNDDRSPRFFISQIQDFTARKFAEEQIRLSEHKYRTLFETMIQGVIYQDASGKIISANSSALKILGVNFDQLIGRTSMDLRWHAIHEDGSPYPGDAHPAMVSLRTGMESSGLMGVFNPVAGKYSWINVSARPEFRPGEDQPFQVYTTFEEITELKESLEELKRTSEKLSILRQIDGMINNMDWNDVAVNEMAMKAILKMIPCQNIFILSFDYESGEAVVESRVDNGIFESNVIKRVPISFFNLSKFDKDKTYVKHIDKTNPASKMEEWAVSMGLSEVLAIPFVSEERIFGVFALFSDNPDQFNTENIQLAEDIGAQISINLHKRELYRKLTQYTEGLEQRVEERTKEIQSLSNIQEAILSSVPDLMFRISREGVFLDVHSHKRDTLFVPPETFLGKRIDEILPPEIATISMKALQDAFLLKKPVAYEYKLPVGNEMQYYENRIMTISEDEALAIIRDITDRKSAERALRWNESLLRMMTASSPLAFFVVDNRTDEILYFNHQFCEIWGITHLEEQMKKRELKNNDIIPHCLPVLKDIEAFAESCKPLQFEENQVVLEDVIPFLDGRFIRRFSTQIRDAEAQYYGRLYIFEDITQRKSVEQFIGIQRDLANGLSTSTDLEEALAHGLEAALKLELVDCGGIYLLDDQKMELKLVVHSGLSEAFIRDCSCYKNDTRQYQLVLSGNKVFGPFEEVANTGVLPHAEDRILGLSVIPIQHEGKVVGCLNIGSKKSSTFFEKIKAQLEALALQMGGAVSRIFAEQALHTSQENFRRFFNTLDDLMFILDINGMIKMTNPVVEKMLGYSAEELQKMHVLEIHPPERREEAGRIVNEMLAGKSSFCPVPVMTKDGRLIPVETRVILGKWDEKEVLFGISRDITERQEAEKELQLRESYLSAVIRNHPGMFWMKDQDGKFLLVNDRNDQFLKISNLSQVETVIGGTDFDFLPKEEAEYYKKEDQQVIQTRSPLVVEEFRTVDDNIVWFEKFKFPVVDKQGEVIGVSAYSMDITGRKKLEKSLFEAIEREKELNELKTKFISVASHEFRTPLATILASSESLSSYWARMTAEQREQRLDKIKNQVGQLNKIIEEVLHLSKMQAKDKALEPEMFDIAGMCKEIIEEFRNRPGELPSIDLNTGADPVNVYLDKKRIRMVLTNLLSNAVKYTEPGKEVSVKIRREKDRISILVKDQGIGIPKEDIKHMFEPFFRASNAVNFPGTGLGLNIVKESVVRHGGKINVRSKLNEGTLFTVSLPFTVEII